MCYSKAAENTQKEKKIDFFFFKVEALPANWPDTDFKTTLMFLSDSALPGLERQGWKGYPGEDLGSTLGNKYAFTAGKSKQTQNLKGCVTKEK